jgi:peptidoglycan/LPS O-acetylase OafA/YrhL
MIKNEIRPLTGIRGIAALWVVLHHFESDITRIWPCLSVLHPLSKNGSIGVDLFFVLSGFVLSTVYKPETFKLTPQSYTNFLLNRVARIYPNYLFCLLVLAAIVIADQLLGKNMTRLADYPVSTFGWHLLMMQAWPLIPAVWANWNSPAWSVSAEWFAYLFVFPLTIGLSSISILKKYGPLFAFALLVIYMAMGPLHLSPGLYFICRITTEFTSGFLMFLYWTYNPKIVLKLASRLDVVVLAFMAAFWLSSISVIGYYAIILIIPIIIVCLTHESSWVAKLLASAPFCYLGRISYALYLVHAIAQRMLHVMLPIDQYANEALIWRLVVITAYFAFTLFSASMIYHLIEEPCRIFIRRRFGSQAP